METKSRQMGVLSNGYTFNEEGFHSRVVQGDSFDCWPYEGGKSTGYGIVVTQSPTGQKTSTTANRVMYDLYGYGVPSGRLRQTCGNRACTNPNHNEEKVKSA